MVNPGPVRSSGSMTWVSCSLISTTLSRPKATFTKCLPAMCATPAIVPSIRTGWPADSSARPPTSMSNGSPTFRPLATTASTAARSAMVAISTSPRSCAITCCRTHVAEPERSGMVGQHHGPGAARPRLPGDLHAVGNGMHRRSLQQRLAPAPCKGRDVLSGLARKLRLAVRHRLNCHADIRHVGEGEAEEDVHIEVGLTRFPDQGVLDQVHPR